VITREDRRAAASVAAVRRPLVRAVDLIASQLRAGGRLLYAGAGTSGRLGVLDEHQPSGELELLVDVLDRLPGRFGADLREGANEELYGGWPMVLSGLKTLLETGELLTTPASLLYIADQQK